MTAAVDATVDVRGAMPATLAEVWSWLAEVEDPEIPVISIVDLGIVRDGRLIECRVTPERGD